MPTHGPILVPLDGSALAQAALPRALTLARVERCPIELLAVVEPLDRLPDAPILASLVTDEMRSRLHGIAEQLRATGIRVETSVRDGDPADTILDHVAEREVRLVVMTTRGAGELSRRLLGGVADKVVRLAPCPVVLHRPEAPLPDWGEPWQPRRMLVPLDGSPLAERALPAALRWTAGLGAELLLVRVEPWSTGSSTANGVPPDLAALDGRAVEAAAEYLAQRRQEIPAGVPVQVVVPRGDPAERLVDYARQRQVDLIVMTAHGQGGSCRVVLGRVADRLVHEGLPVCIVHATAPVSAETAEAGGTPA